MNLPEEIHNYLLENGFSYRKESGLYDCCKFDFRAANGIYWGIKYFSKKDILVIEGYFANEDQLMEMESVYKKYVQIKKFLLEKGFLKNGRL